MPFYYLPDFVYSGVFVGRDERHRRYPFAFADHLEHHLNVGGHLVGPLLVGFVDNEYVGDLHDAGFHDLNVVAHAGGEDEAHGVGDLHDIDLRLPDADGLDYHDVKAAGVEYQSAFVRPAADAAKVAARAHTADEDALFNGVVLHTQAVSQNRAAGEGARRVYGDHADLLSFRSELRNQTVHEGTLTCSWTARYANHLRPAGFRIYGLHYLLRGGGIRFDKADKASYGSRVSG